MGKRKKYNERTSSQLDDEHIRKNDVCRNQNFFNFYALSCFSFVHVSKKKINEAEIQKFQIFNCFISARNSLFGPSKVKLLTACHVNFLETFFRLDSLRPKVCLVQGFSLQQSSTKVIQQLTKQRLFMTSDCQGSGYYYSILKVPAKIGCILG